MESNVRIELVTLFGVEIGRNCSLRSKTKSDLPQAILVGNEVMLDRCCLVIGYGVLYVCVICLCHTRRSKDE